MWTNQETTSSQVERRLPKCKIKLHIQHKYQSFQVDFQNFQGGRKMTKDGPNLADFNVDNCHVCTDINDWSKKARKAAFADSSKPYEPFPCPPSSNELGSSTWTFLHTMAAYYPEKPNTQTQKDMKTFLTMFSRFYPCNYCAEHLRQEMEINPPEVESRERLSQWFCRMHNEVNYRLGKPIFDCSKVLERWRTGRKECFKK